MLSFFLYTIPNLGINPDIPVRDRKYIRRINAINMICILFLSISVITATVLFQYKDWTDIIRVSILINMSVLIIALNYLQLHTLAKLLTLLSPYFILFVYPFITGVIHEGQLLTFPWAIMVLGSFTISLFSIDQDKVLMIILLVFFFLSSVLCDQVLIYYSPHILDTSHIYEYYFYYKSTQLLIGTLLYSNLFLLKMSDHMSHIAMRQLNEVLDEKNKSLLSLNNNLERMVSERTEQLRHKNQKIKEIAFANAHHLRAAIARIIGLLKLSNKDLPKEDLEFCRIKILESADELNQMTITIANKLNQDSND